MPKMSICRCAAAMCGARASETTMFRSPDGSVAYGAGEYDDVMRMIRSGATDDDIGLAHPRWRGCVMIVRKALSDSR